MDSAPQFFSLSMNGKVSNLFGGKFKGHIPTENFAFEFKLESTIDPEFLKEPSSRKLITNSAEKKQSASQSSSDSTHGTFATNPSSIPHHDYEQNVLGISDTSKKKKKKSKSKGTTTAGLMVAMQTQDLDSKTTALNASNDIGEMHHAPQIEIAHVTDIGSNPRAKKKKKKNNLTRASVQENSDDLPGPVFVQPSDRFMANEDSPIDSDHTKIDPSKSTKSKKKKKNQSAVRTDPDVDDFETLLHEMKLLDAQTVPKHTVECGSEQKRSKDPKVKSPSESNIGPSFISTKDPKLKFGNGKNIVAIGPPKRRDPMWLKESVATVELARAPEPISHTSPFSFGFGV